MKKTLSKMRGMRKMVPLEKMDRYNSVEFSSDNRSLAYQFKIWDIESMPMCILIREDSNVLSQIQAGDILDMTYNSAHSRNSFEFESEHRKTAIREIIKKDQGRFKGHSLVGLEILENRG